MSGCEVRVSPKPGIISNSIALTTRETSENPDIGLLVIQRLSDSEATTVSVTSLKAPSKALKAFEKANRELALEKPNFGKAVKELEKAVKEYPQYSEAWDLMARAHLSQGEVEEGRECFLRAIEEEPKFISPYLGLAQLAVQESDWDGTVHWTGKVLQLDATLPQALYWSGMAHFYLNKHDQTEKDLTSLYEQGYTETYPFGLLLAGVVHANQGKIQSAAEELQLYLRLMPPEEVPEAQRSELERQLASWQSEGLATLPEAPASEPETP
jgi:tetratricopeptide (TPR) repeat protein